MTRAQRRRLPPPAPSASGARDFPAPRGLRPGLRTYRLYPDGRLSLRFSFTQGVTRG